MNLLHKDFLFSSHHADSLLHIAALAFDQTETIAGIMDIRGRYVSANQSLLQHWDITFDQIKGFSLLDIPWLNLSPVEKKKIKAMIKQTQSGKTVKADDMHIFQPSDRAKLNFTLSPLFDANRNVIGLIYQEDAASKPNINQIVDKEKWETQQWIDSMGSFVAKCDPKGKVITCNRALLNVLNMKIEDVVGRFVCDIIKLTSLNRGRQKLQNAISQAKDGHKKSMEINCSLTDDTSANCLFNVSPIKDNNGNISFLAVEIIDISEQVKLRELVIAKEKAYSSHLEKEVNEIDTALRKTEQFNKNLVDSAPMGIIYLDENDRVLFANPEMLRKFEIANISPDHIKGKKITDLNLFPAFSSWEKNNDFHNQKIDFGQMKMLLNYDNNKSLQFEVHTGPLISSEGTKGTVLIMDDVTERNRLEKELFRTQIQSEKMSSLELLISGVAHELNNPLTSIIGCAEFLFESFKLDQDHIEAAKIIVSDARRAGKIVKSLLAFARQSVSEGTTINLNEIIITILGIRVHEMESKGIRAALDLNWDIQPIEADATQIQQVILNLIANAMYAIESAGIGNKISIKTYIDGNWAIMEIKDNGPGIPEIYRSKIFDPFFTTKPPGKGTGLGLSIVYGIIQKHEGCIYTDTTIGSGTCFKVMLPLSKTSALPLQQSLSPVVSYWIPPRVLVVDDEPNICITLSRYLKDLDCYIDTASNGREAMEKIENNVYDLLLVDVKMPVMDGPELYEKLSSDYPHLCKRFAFMTGISAETNHILQTTKVPILQKPFSRKDIMNFFLQLEKVFEINL